MDFRMSKSQLEFIESQSAYTLYAGGLGSGKTFAGAVWALYMILKYPGVNGLITANSYRQLKTATLVTFIKLLDECKIKYSYHVNDNVFKIGKSRIYAMSMEKYDLLRGIEVGWAWSDECAFYTPQSFDVLIGRIRDKKGTCQWKGTTTPNGFNWLYEKFVEKPLPGSHVVRSSTLENAVNLPQSYVQALRDQYDKRLAQQEIDGEFVNLNSGKVYYAFDRRTHLHSVSSTHRLIYVGLDFNVHPLCGVFCINDGVAIRVVDELYLENSNTFAAAKEIMKRYPYQPVQVIPDETGNRRKSSASATDHEILRRAGLEVLHFRNPQVKDRWNNLNRLFDQKKLTIDPKCVNLIKDLEQLTYDNKEESLGHISDALGYVTWHLDPLQKPRRPAQVSYRG